MVDMPEIPDEDHDFTPDLARKIIGLYQTRIRALEEKLAKRLRVKPLEWSQGWGERRANTPFGKYRFITTTYGHYTWYSPDGGRYWASDEKSAKAAAQADYERRILSALEATPPAPMVTEALKAALTTMHRYQRAGCGDDVFYDDLSQSIRKVEAALTAAQEAGKP